MGTALLAAVVIGNMSGLRPQYAGKGLLVLGCFLGPLFPLLLGLLFRMLTPPAVSADAARYPEYPGTAFSLLFACGSLGGLALAPLVGVSARERHFHAALRIPLVIAMLLAAATVVFVLLAGRIDGN